MLPSVPQLSLDVRPIDWTGLPTRFMDHGNKDLETLIALIRSVNPRHVIEFGVNVGRTAKAIMANAQQEEFKHFAMDLEFLTRRTEKWRIALKTTLFTDGDIVEAGERAEEAEGLG